MTDSANYVRRRMKQYLRTCTLSQRTFSKRLMHSRTSVTTYGNEGESKTESQDRIEEKVNDEAEGAAMYVASAEDSRRNPIDVPVRGLQASLRQVSGCLCMKHVSVRLVM